MASFYSKPADYGTYTQPINLELVNFVMGSKQQKYDYNLEKVQSKIKDELGSLDLERAEDKEYFLERAQGALKSAGDLTKLDWSKNGVVRDFDARMNSVIDDKVLGDVISTRNYRSFQNSLAEKQKKNDGSYDPTNVAFAMNEYGVNDWLRGEADSVGSIQYQDYTDVGAELNDISENLDKYARVIKRQTPSGDGKYWITEEGKQLSAAEVRRIAEAQLTNKAKSQMRINGWANYDAGVRSTDEIIGDFKKFKDNKIAETDKVINGLTAKIKNLQGTGAPELKEYTAQLEAWKNQRGEVNSTYQKWIDKGSTSNITTTMESERVLGQFGETFSINNIGSTMDNNPYTLADYNSRLRREEQAEAIAMKAAAKQTEEQKVVNDQFGFATPTTAKGGAAYNEVNRYRDVENDIANYQNDFKQSVNSVYNSILEKDPQVAATLKADYDKNSGISLEAYMEDQIRIMGEQSSNFVTKKDLQNIDSAKIRRDNAIKVKTNTDNQAFDVLESSGGSRGGLDNILEEYGDNENILVLDQNGNAVNAETLFKANDITNANDLNKNPEVKDALLKSYYADKIIALSKRGKNRPTTTPQTGEYKQMMGRAGLAGQGAIAMVEGRYEATAKELETIDLVKGRLIQKFGGDVEKAEEFINNAQAKGVGVDTIKFNITTNTDDSVTQDTSLDAWITPDNIARTGSNILAETGESTRKDVVVINGDTPMAEDLTNRVHASIITTGGAIAGEVKEGASYTLEDMGNGTVNVYFQSTVKGEIIQQRANLPVANLPASITSAINFNEVKPLFNNKTMKEVATPVSLLDQTDVKGIKGAAEIMNVPREVAANKYTKEGMTKTVFGTYGDIVGTKAQPTAVGTALRVAINSKDLVSKVENVDGDFMFRVFHKDPVTGYEQAIYSPGIEIPEKDLDAAYMTTKYVPQALIYKMLQNSLARTRAEGEGNLDSTLEKIMNIYGQ